MSDDGEEKEHDPISQNQLHNFHKDMVSDDLQVKKDATKYMRHQLQNTSRALIQLAEEKMEEREGGQIEQRDVEAAFNQALRSYTIIDDFLTVLGEYEYELKQEASRTNILHYALDDDE